MFVLACIFLVVYVIGIFALFAWLLYKRRLQIRDEERHVAFMSVLHSDNKPRFYYGLNWYGLPEEFCFPLL